MKAYYCNSHERILELKAELEAERGRPVSYAEAEAFGQLLINLYIKSPDNPFNQNQKESPKTSSD